MNVVKVQESKDIGINLHPMKKIEIIDLLYSETFPVKAIMVFMKEKYYLMTGPRSLCFLQ